MRKVMLAAIAALWPWVGHAMTGEQLLDDYCSKPGGAIVCGAYTAGLGDSLATFAPAGTFCPPHHLTIGQAQRVFEKYMRDNPARLNEDAPLLYRSAMREAFPCHPAGKGER
jgi:hypothetical protein